MCTHTHFSNSSTCNILISYLNESKNQGLCSHVLLLLGQHKTWDNTYTSIPLPPPPPPPPSPPTRHLHIGTDATIFSILCWNLPFMRLKCIIHIKQNLSVIQWRRERRRKKKQVKLYISLILWPHYCHVLYSSLQYRHSIFNKRRKESVGSLGHRWRWGGGKWGIRAEPLTVFFTPTDIPFEKDSMKMIWLMCWPH